MATSIISSTPSPPSATTTTTTPSSPPASAPSADDLKRAAARRAVDLYVHSNMVIGLGTGSTAAHFIDYLAHLLLHKSIHNIVAVPTSLWAADRAVAAGIPLSDLNSHPFLDLSIDGADEVDPYLNLVKGRGGSLLREKLVEAASKRFVVIVDESKLVDKLGGSRLAVPVEVVAFGWEHTLRHVRQVFDGMPGFDLKLRTAFVNAKVEKEDGFETKPFVTDNGNYIIDLFFDKGIEGDLKAIGDEILKIVGVVEHGMFLGMADNVVIAGKDGIFVKNKEDLR